MRTHLLFLSALLLWMGACSEGPRTPLSPSSGFGVDGALNPDGSTLKVAAPADLRPDDETVGTTRPSVSFTNAAGLFVSVGFAYEIEVQNVEGAVVYSMVIGESPGSSAHTIPVELPRGQTFWWRVRARLGDHAGPWSGFATFHVAADATSAPASPPGPPSPLPPGASPLPFPVPAECGPFGPGDRSACVAAMVSVSPWWPACHGGSGVGCHRFTRSVAAALAVHDERWGLISKNPGEQQCGWDWCAPGDGSGYGEDVVAYHTGGGNWVGWDIVGGAGAPGASPQWAQVGGRRAGNDWRPVPPFP